MAAANRDRKSLEKRLSDFLGIDEDDVVDVLDQLLAIEGKDDLLDYLSQLLGSRDDQVKGFVDDIGRLQQGLPLLEQQQDAVVVKEESIPVVLPERKTKQTTKTNPCGPPQKQSPPKQVSGTLVASTDRGTSNENAALEPAMVVPPASKKVEEPKPPPPPKKKYGLPPNGKAKTTCGCFGTLHRPLTNCLYCGRISCAEEGYDFCPYCGYLVEEVQPPKEGEQPDSSQAKAWQHKERLLRYDRESAQRTVILDDQADYYSSRNSSWLTEDEQYDAEAHDSKQRDNLHKKKHALNIAF